MTRSLNPDEFSIADQGRSPLNYHRFQGPRNRLALVHPALELPPAVRRLSQNERTVQDFEYFAPQALVGKGLNNRKLKTPKLVNNPSAALPGTGAFIDFLDMSQGAPPEEQKSVYIDYVRRRDDLPRMGAADRLIRSVAESRPNARLNFGRVMSPRVWSVGESLREEGRNVEMQRDF
jgi:hypothetical protein